MRRPFGQKAFLLTGLLTCLLALLAAAPSPALANLIWEQTNNPSASDDNAQGVAVDSTGIYVVGTDNSLGNEQWRIEKRDLTTGNPIWTKTSNPSNNDGENATGVAVDSTGIYVVGQDRSLGSTNPQWRIEKRDLTTGDPIWTQTRNPTGGYDGPTGVAVDSTGIYTVGAANWLGDGYISIEKRDLDGNPLWTQTSDPSTNPDSANGVAIDSTGIYAVGNQNWFGGAATAYYLEKRDLDGNPLWTKTINNPDYGSDTYGGVTVDSTGIYVVGPGYSAANGVQWLIEKRSLANGNLIWAQTSNPSPDYDVPADIAIDSTGIYVVGRDDSPGSGVSQWRIEKRDLTTGDPIWTQTNDPSTGYDAPEDVAVDSTGVYIGGEDSSPGNYQWRIEKWTLSGGSGGGGVDCGLRAFDGASTVTIDCEDPAVSPLRIQKGGTTYGINLVDPGDPGDSKLRIQTPSGVKALRKQ